MQRSEELRDLVLASWEAYSRGDTSFIDRHTSTQEGVRLIGSDPEEWFEGERVAEVLKEEMEAGGVTVSPRGEVDAFVEGDVGWMSSRLVWILEDGTEIPARATAVFRREADEWKTVQLHTSVGVPNEDLPGG